MAFAVPIFSEGFAQVNVSKKYDLAHVRVLLQILGNIHHNGIKSLLKEHLSFFMHRTFFGLIYLDTFLKLFVKKQLHKNKNAPSKKIATRCTLYTFAKQTLVQAAQLMLNCPIQQLQSTYTVECIEPLFGGLFCIFCEVLYNQYIIIHAISIGESKISTRDGA